MMRLLRLAALAVALLLHTPQPPVTVTLGTDAFWQMFEDRHSCNPCPTEQEAARLLKLDGIEVQP